MPKTCGANCASPRSEGQRVSNTDAQGQKKVAARERREEKRERVMGRRWRCEKGVVERYYLFSTFSLFPDLACIRWSPLYWINVAVPSLVHRLKWQFFFSGKTFIGISRNNAFQGIHISLRSSS